MQGTILGERYGITRHLSTGRFSQTYLAEDLDLPGNPRRILRQILLQSRHPQLVKYARHLFKKETRILTEVGEHPQIPTLYDRFERNYSFYLIQDYIEGECLADFLTGQLLTEAQTISLLQEILQLLAFVHQRGLIHRAINPHSFIRRGKDGRLALIDFGSVQQIGTLDINARGTIGIRGAIATPGYAPQFSRGKADASYDVYAVGAIGLQSLTGLSPNALPRDERGRLCWQEKTDISDRFAEFLARALEESGDRRYPNATEALKWLNASPITEVNEKYQTIATKATIPLSQTPLPIPQTSFPAAHLLCGRYRLLDSLGEGGFSCTFLAQDEKFPGMPECVVKHLQPYRKTPETLHLARRLFDSEARVLSQLGQHPQIPRLLAHFEEDNEFYLVQEYIAGHDLQQELGPGRPLPESTVIIILRDLLEILAFVHQTKVIHRDIKPANIRRRKEDSKLVLIDFGAVKQIEERLDKNGSTGNLTVGIGTPGYIPSEQAQGKPKFSSDVYAAGIIAIEALTGKDPERLPEDPDTGELLWRQGIEISNDLAEIIDRMVRYDFRQRYFSAEEAFTAIDAFLHRPTQPLQRSPFSLPSISPRLRQLLLGSGVILTISIALFWAGRDRQPSQVSPRGRDIPAAIAPATEPETPVENTLPELAGEIIPLNFQAIDAEYHPVLNKIAIATNDPPRLVVYSPLSRRQQEIPLDYPPIGLSVGPKGEFAVVGHDRHLSLVNLRAGRVRQTRSLAIDLFDAVLGHNSRTYLSSQRDRRLWAIDWKTDTEMQTPEDETRDFSQTYWALHPRGKRLFGITGRSRSPMLQQIDLEGEELRPTQQYQPIYGDFSKSRYLWFDREKRRVFTNDGSIFRPSRDRREIEIFRLNVDKRSQTHLQSTGRLSFSSLSQKITVLDRDSTANSLAFDRLSIFDYHTLQLQKVLLLPTVRVNGESQRLTGRFVFANTRSGEYYILAKSFTSQSYLIVSQF
ncbi:MAG: protein kinase [Cyanobacteria bacterium SBLK]|nr:protein kinase [Cyanobacteria bacterium SBLK]